ncbi:MAG: hypothetical protein AVDCRST_MAG68-2345, partial [uncultured Gemmatimonadetes bacterium]
GTDLRPQARGVGRGHRRHRGPAERAPGGDPVWRVLPQQRRGGDGAARRPGHGRGGGSRRPGVRDPPV